mmetsp:Transcript_11907/g.28606  ORF Transcript_11907/g.28606 Transcript_11907/m.28606 type:complete len:948 (+) Transcript_11907:69-2912(+)
MADRQGEAATGGRGGRGGGNRNRNNNKSSSKGGGSGGENPNKKNQKATKKNSSRNSASNDDNNKHPSNKSSSASARGGGGGGGSRRGNNKSNNRNSSSNKSSIVYPPYKSLPELLVRYNAKDPQLIRGKIRVLPGIGKMAFCTCDRGSQSKDVVLETPLERNRALDGDIAFVELVPPEEEQEQDEKKGGEGREVSRRGGSRIETFNNTTADDDDDEDEDEAGDTIVENNKSPAAEATRNATSSSWQDDQLQVDLWDPIVPLERRTEIPQESTEDDDSKEQRRGRVVYVYPPRQQQNEIRPSEEVTSKSTKRIVGTLKRLLGGTALLTSSNKSLDQFRLSNSDAEKFKDAADDAIFQAKYTYGSWKDDCRWPPCSDVEQFGMSGNVEDETAALLIDNDVDHGEFPVCVLDECQDVVKEGEYSNGTESGWKPTPDMYKDRRDYRQQRIFTIDPTTAKDLDDALHITDLGNGEVELGVHIADVSHFIPPNSQIDLEAQRRCTTVYLVDRTIPMLPRPLCEIACSLNENVERLAFSCVWRMNLDGSLVKNQKTWYGRSVIKSCARLDYSTAQNIIENKVAFGENEINEELWPLSRRPTGGHTIEEVAADVRLMNTIAQARRRMRMQNGALTLNAVKLTFKLDDDRETPLMCEPYPIRDSNKLVEEYMLLANYLVAQRLITHTGDRACLRHHEPPKFEGLEKAAELAKEAIGFNIDLTSSQSLQGSLNRLARECQDEIVLKCITEILKAPMRPANYIAAGEIPREAWAHFALHIPYYTHFTSPIRRYADVIVHRLLQASIDGQEAVEEFPLSVKEIGNICCVCNEKKDGSRKAQERSDTVFLALYLRRYPMKSQMGVVVSIGEKAFTVFLPALGVSQMLYLEEHKNWIEYESYEAPNVGNRIKLRRIQKHKGQTWKEIVVKNFYRVLVTCKCNDKPPINVKLELEGPWTGEV